MKNDIITFKGRKEGLTVYCDEEASWEDVVDSLNLRLQGKDGSFFEGACVAFDAGMRSLTPEQVNSLWQTFQENGLTIRSVKTAGNEHDFNEKLDSLIKGKDNEIRDTDEVSKLPTLVVRRNVRSGQDITYAGNVIVFGDVKPGSKITASGFIMVMGSLRGTVHAGAEGDENVWVGALDLQPAQLRISNCISRAPDEEPVVAEVARIYDGTIVVRELKGIANNF